MILNSKSKYGLISKVFHWFMAFGIISMIIFGIIMVNLPASSVKGYLFCIRHLVSCCLALLRLLDYCAIWSPQAIKSSALLFLVFQDVYF